MEKLIKFFKDEEGASAVEYGILIALIAAAVITVVGFIGSKINNAFQSVNAKLS
jgi:pilus assembly protein Flp/PilA